MKNIWTISGSVSKRGA